MESKNEKILKRLIELEIYSGIEKTDEVFAELQKETFSNIELKVAISQFDKRVLGSRKNQVVF